MTDHIPRRFDRIEDLIADMESTVDDVGSWAKAFQAVSTSALEVDAAAVAVMAIALEAVADRLGDYWSEAIELTRLEPAGRSVGHARGQA